MGVGGLGGGAWKWARAERALEAIFDRRGAKLMARFLRFWSLRSWQGPCRGPLSGVRFVRIGFVGRLGSVREFIPGGCGSDMLETARSRLPIRGFRTSIRNYVWGVGGRIRGVDRWICRGTRGSLRVGVSGVRRGFGESIWFGGVVWRGRDGWAGGAGVEKLGGGHGGRSAGGSRGGPVAVPVG